MPEPTAEQKQLQQQAQYYHQQQLYYQQQQVGEFVFLHIIWRNVKHQNVY